MDLTLKRLTAADPDGVPGVLMCNGSIICLTLEEEDRNNEKNVSCIPTGTYVCKRITRPSGMVTFEITGVPNRTHILFHPGTDEQDTEGCVLTGSAFAYLDAKDEESGKIEKQLSVQESKKAFERFMDFVGNRDSFVLHVKWC